MAQGGSYLDKLLLGLKSVWWNGVPVTPRPNVNFLGGLVADNPGLGTTDVTLGSGSSTTSGITTVESNGTAQPLRLAINFVGLDVSDDVTHNRTNVTLDYSNSAASGVLLVPHGGTGVATLPAASVLTGDGTSPIGAITAGPNGYVLTMVSSAPAWAPATGGAAAFGGDLSPLSTSTDQWVQSISGPNGAGDPSWVSIGIDADSLQFHTSRMPFIGQDPTGDRYAQHLVLAPQASTDPNGNPGSVIALLGVENGSGAAALLEVAYGSTGYVCGALGRVASVGPCLWLLDPGAGSGIPNGGNYTLQRFGSSLYINTPDGVSGNFFFNGVFSGEPTAMSISVTNTTMFTGGSLISDGQGWLGVSTVRTVPTATSVGGVLYVKSDNNWYARTSLGEFQLTPTSTLPTLTNHDIVVGQGTTTPTFLAPGTAGHVARSNGTDWLSAQLAYTDLSGTPTLPTVSGSSSVTVSGGPAYTVSLPSSGTSTGTFGSGTTYPIITVNADGILTAAGNQEAQLQSTGYTDGTTIGNVALSVGAAAVNIADTLTMTVPTGGALVAVWYSTDIVGSGSPGTEVIITILVDGSPLNNDPTCWGAVSVGATQPFGGRYMRVKRVSLAAGSHTFSMQAAVPSGGVNAANAQNSEIFAQVVTV